MKLVYVAGPYTAPDFLGVERHIALAREACALLASWRIGYLSPHMNSAHMDVIVPNVEPEFWYEMTMEMLRRSDAILLLPHYEASSGTMREVDEAKKLGLAPFWFGLPHELEKLRRWYFEGQR